jgi:type I restriction enzyme, S subunit
MMQQINKPVIRFAPFEAEWIRTQLGATAQFSKGKGLSKSDISEDGVTECIRYGELYTFYGETIHYVQSKTNVPLKNLVLSEANDVIIPASGETQLEIATASCVLKAGIALGGDLNIIKTPHNGVFLSYYLNSVKKYDIAILAQGTSVVHLYASQLATLMLNLPTLPEQQKIAAFFASIDTRLEQLRKQQNLLEAYKKGIMQQIFAQQWRFKQNNGADFPDWKEQKLGAICTIKTGKLDANAMVENGKYRFYTCAKDYSKIDTFAFDTEALLISGNGANVGYIHYYKGKFNAYQRTYVLDKFQEHIVFVKYLLDEFLYERIFFEKKESNTPYIVLSKIISVKTATF